MKKILINLVLIFGVIEGTVAQRLTDMVNYPITPQASAIFKSIAAPVSYYTGQPNVSIPIYTISQDGVQVPISISFSTSGILVTEEATNVGIGVRLNWGGSIVRSTNGQADERGFFYEDYKTSTNLSWNEVKDCLGSKYQKEFYWNICVTEPCNTPLGKSLAKALGEI